ncbi:periplasmic nitrate reductase, NapE protein [Ruegeria arenilitoris]|uniref:periplasmic nitrate reductase, NapE protein n=1 Tax=Ruegeria arenilitoris TaxID=1173585 RepID=UPI0014805EE5|nr:periplasmic nitrate reductase, NapE protein [Ruegeria arenilitoris]
MSDQSVSRSKGTARREWLSFLFITLILLPGITVLGVGVYGFTVWLLQMIYGPPTGSL